MSNYKYTDEMEARMRAATANGATPEVVTSLAKEFNFSERSVAAKLRSLKVEVPSNAEGPKFSAEETKAFTDFLSANNGTLTAAEIASQFMSGKFTNRQVMGKALALEMTSSIKKTEKVAKPKTYTEAEESLITQLVGENKFLEEIADALGKDKDSVRGKLLSMKLKAPQRDKVAATKGGSYPDLDTLAPTMTVEELVEHYKTTKENTTPRGIKTALSRRGVNAKNYDAKKAAA